MSDSLLGAVDLLARRALRAESEASGDPKVDALINGAEPKVQPAYARHADAPSVRAATSETAAGLHIEQHCMAWANIMHAAMDVQLSFWGLFSPPRENTLVWKETGETIGS